MQRLRHTFNSFSSERGRFDHFWSMTRPTLAKNCYFRLPPNLAHRKSIDLPNYVPSSRPWGVQVELHATKFSNLVKMALPSGRILSRLLRRMKAFIDEFRPNTSQANYFGGFWRITSEINAKIKVIKQ